jgi:hypothetical protein
VGHRNISIVDSALERQVKGSDELLCRLIEERDCKKLNNTSSNPPPSSSFCIVSFTQTNPQTSGTSTGGTTMPNPSV